MSEPSPVCLPGTETHRLHSRHVGADFELRVARPLPGIMGRLPDQFGVVYVLDGDLYFGMATEMTRLLYQFQRELPPLLVVGIGYGTSDASLQGETRTRDFTPSAPASYGEMVRAMRPGWEPTLPPERRMGGADAFLDFLQDEVGPFLARRYPLREGDTTLFGSSLGGLLGAWGLLTRPGLVARWILTSPALWWDDGMVLARERELAGEGAALEGRVFLAAGSLEEGIGIPQLDAYRLVSNVRTLAGRLESRDDADLRVVSEILDGESHTTVVPAALLRGLRTLHRPAQRPGM